MKAFNPPPFRCWNHLLRSCAELSSCGSYKQARTGPTVGAEDTAAMFGGCSEKQGAQTTEELYPADESIGPSLEFIVYSPEAPFMLSKAGRGCHGDARGSG